MPVTDTIADFLTRIRNASSAKHKTVDVPSSKLKVAIAEILKDQGFIADFNLRSEGVQPTLEVKLRYYYGQPVIREIKRVSKPGRRVYAGVTELPRVRNGLGVAIISTPRGVMSDKQARRENVGGEILCTIW
ncbi:MAG: 30S ribosomal protein S8 [Chlorobi bacterium]|nr:MAG: 30S ribosomal protein S8 [Bacteroidota bacterium]KXK36085.1 MAG: 30S ribosomal protein S8 [Chlorobi bacterium OLB6]MBE2266402.1 30S ribosomal protein S8 [Flavobacteriales bacterium]MBL1160348.1 30S ribosomal protein S8 [Chlorobiota bacterium]MBW7854393.1 30S ribosomal protein S8 [Candidatus Kapabacteria bacterium]MCC6331735.1 30S ribosomal protein S8 [Ignavibacteria bacterium]